MLQRVVTAFLFVGILGCGNDSPLTPGSNDIAYITTESHYFPDTLDARMDVKRVWLGRIGEATGIVNEVLITTQHASVTLLVGNKTVLCDMSSYPDEASLRQHARERSSLTIRGVLEQFTSGRIWLSGCWIIRDGG